MALFDIDYNIKAIEWLPPDKRFPAMVAWTQSMLSQVQYLRDKILGSYRTGYAGQLYIPGFSYSVGDVVLYKQVVFQSLTDNNTTTPPSANWVQYLPSFIGVDTRVLFNGQYLVLTYALNQYFFTNFRQPLLLGYASTPDSTHALYSDIYIANQAFQYVGFRVGENDCAKTGGVVTAVISSTVTENDIISGGYNDWSTDYNGGAGYNSGDVVVYPGAGEYGYLYLSLTNNNTTEPEIGDDTEPPSGNWHRADTIGWSSPFLAGDNFIIWVPAYVYDYYLNFEQDCRNFVNKIIPEGINYEIKTYNP